MTDRERVGWPKSVDDVRARIATAEARLQALGAEWLVLDASATALANEERRRGREHHEGARGAALDDHARTLVTIDDSRSTVAASAAHHVLSTAATLAPGAFGWLWEADGWQSLHPATTVGRHVRVGSLGTAGRRVPIVLPLLGTAGWVVRAAEPDFAGLVRGVVLRLVATLGPLGLRLLAYDPPVSAGVAAFAPLRERAPDSVRATTTSQAAFSAELARVGQELAYAADALAQAGLATLVDATLARGRPPYPFHLLVVNGVTGLDERTVNELRQLATYGAAHGLVCLLRCDGPDTAPLSLPVLRIESGVARSDHLDGVAWDVDSAPPADVMDRALEAVLGWAPESTEVVAFHEVLDQLSDRWVDPGDEGLRAVIGRTSSGRPLAIELRSENPPMPNALVGGAVGQGKSNLLLVMIHALAAQYSPTDLEMVLLDFRDGVEFAPLGPRPEEPSWLPHVVVLGLEADREFGLAVLQDMMIELSRRTAAFKAAGVSKINDYRRRTGESMPRRLLIVDEFQRLVDGDDEVAEQCTRLLDDLARTGRAAGFHLVLASQTVSGVRGLAARADAIFAQFHNRVSLRNTAAESRAILGPQNPAAARLNQPGEVIVNGELGDLTANRHGFVARANPAELASLRRELWLSAPTRREPVVFRRSVYARWPGVGEQGTSDELALAVGAPISVREVVRTCTLGRGGDQTVAVVGPEAHVVAAILVGVVASVREAVGQMPEVWVLDADTTTATPSGTGQRVVDAAAACRIVVRHVLGGEVPTALQELTQVDQGGRRVVIGIGLDALRDLEQPDPQTFRAAQDDLRDLAQHGSERGCYLVGWWRARRAVDHQLGFDGAGVRGWAFCGASRDDVRAVCGAQTQLPGGSPRLLWYDRSDRRGPETLVPFDLAEVTGP